MTNCVIKAVAALATILLVIPSDVRSEDGADVSHVQRRTSLSQFGITWTFDKEYPCGQFANGDWWVVGPVTVTEISPGLSDGRNGSMANPIPAHEQGYDNRAWNYNRGLSVQTPFEMGANVSLVSTISNADTGSRKLIELKTAAVLTCLAEVPAAGTFRPPFCGTTKPLHNVRQLKRELLPSLASVAGAPTLSEAERWFERPWLSHLNHYKSQDIHPADNMPNYGREVGKQTGDAALLLALDIPDKDTLLIRFVQYGIDNYGIFNSGGFWPHNGGHQMGRKWPILFAGMMLGDQAMSGIGSDPRKGRKLTFQEDDQTFYVSQSEVDATHDSQWGPTHPRHQVRTLPYEQRNIGLPEWGILHVGRSSKDNMHFTEVPYRAINLAGMAGIVLAARIFDQTDAWNHPPLFDYFDRGWDLTGRTFHLDRNAATPFTVSMWNTYREDYGRVWKRKDMTPVSLDDEEALGDPNSAFYSPGIVGSTR
jgi:hypothetical protein